MKYILNGRLHEDEHILVPLENNGAFLYGDGFFESGRIINRKWMFQNYHWERIVASFELLKMKNPFSSVSELYDGILQIADTKKNSRLRISFWRDTSGGYSAGSFTNYLVQATPYDSIEYPLNENGLQLGVYSDLLKSISPLSNLKSISSQICVLATQFAQENNLDEAILLNASGNIIETNRSNIWLVKDKMIITPVLSEGCLNGIMRKVIFDLASKAGIEVKESIVTREDLYSAGEVFISGSVRGIQWVQKANNTTYSGNVVSQLLSNRLNASISS